VDALIVLMLGCGSEASEQAFLRSANTNCSLGASATTSPNPATIFSGEHLTKSMQGAFGFLAWNTSVGRTLSDRAQYHVIEITTSQFTQMNNAPFVINSLAEAGNRPGNQYGLDVICGSCIANELTERNRDESTFIW